MCTYTTAQVAVSGSGKGPADWVRVGRATVYLDHPVHAMADHTLNIDLVDPDRGPGARVALELEPRSALALRGDRRRAGCRAARAERDRPRAGQSGRVREPTGQRRPFAGPDTLTA